MSQEMCKSCGAHLDEFDPSRIIRKGFCPYCVDQEGNIKPYDQILEGMISFIEEEMPEVAEKDRKEKADDILLGCAVWKKSKKVIFAITELKSFRANTLPNTWGSETSNNRTEDAYGSETWEYSEGEWAYKDNFVGNSPFAGREIITYTGVPVWSSSYFGYMLKDSEVEYSEIENFLKKVLRESKHFYRGELESISGDWKYLNHPMGDVEYFTGEEEIFFKGKKVYHCHYLGGLVG